MNKNAQAAISASDRTWVPHISIVRCGILVLALLTLEAPANSQGCAQCRDNAAANSPATQAAYRHAIELLVGTAGTLFAGTVLILKRTR